jgi:hypothetical protein
VIAVDEEVLKVFIYSVPPNLGRINVDGGRLYTNSFRNIFLRCIKGTWVLINLFYFYRSPVPELLIRTRQFDTECARRSLYKRFCLTFQMNLVSLRQHPFLSHTSK